MVSDSDQSENKINKYPVSKDSIRDLLSTFPYEIENHIIDKMQYQLNSCLGSWCHTILKDNFLKNANDEALKKSLLKVKDTFCNIADKAEELNSLLNTLKLQNMSLKVSNVYGSHSPFFVNAENLLYELSKLAKSRISDLEDDPIYRETGRKAKTLNLSRKLLILGLESIYNGISGKKAREQGNRFSTEFYNFAYACFGLIGDEVSLDLTLKQVLQK